MATNEDQKFLVNEIASSVKELYKELESFAQMAEDLPVQASPMWSSPSC